MVSTAVILVVMSGETCNDLDSKCLGCSLDLWHVKGVDYGRFVRRFVDENIRIIVSSDWYRNDVHPDCLKDTPR